MCTATLLVVDFGPNSGLKIGAGKWHPILRTERSAQLFLKTVEMSMSDEDAIDINFSSVAWHVLHD